MPRSEIPTRTENSGVRGVVSAVSKSVHSMSVPMRVGWRLNQPWVRFRLELPCSWLFGLDALLACCTRSKDSSRFVFHRNSTQVTTCDLNV